ncbi:TPA: LamG domain-containing protein, partial [Candidatus Poribacteria bacterium]|nr:LamG domain-containing protein [Candidatus Poribacteria bacterium]
SGLAGAAITEIRHDASSVIQPGDYALSAKVNAGTTSISNMSDTIIDHGNSPSTQLGDYTVSAKVKSGNADISNLSGTSINQISHDASVQPGNYSLSVVETQVSTGYALQFDGSNDYVKLPDFSSLQDMSFSGWVKIDSRNYWERIFDFGRGGSGDMFLSTMGGRTGGNLEMTIHPFGGTHTINPGVTLEDGEWHHVVFTYDKGGSGMKLYVDGVNKGSNSYNTASFADFGGGQNFYLGKANWNDPYFDGAMDEVGIFNTALTANEVSAIHNGGSGLDLASNSGDYQSSSNLQGYWNFNEDSGNTVTDLSGNGNHGTLINGPTRVSSTTPSTTRSLRITAPDATTHEVIYDMTDTSVDFPSLGLQVNTSNLSNMTSILLNNPHTFTINPTLEVTPPVGPTVETEYSFNNNSQTIDFSGLDIDVHTNNAQAMTNTLLDNSEDFTINPTLKIVAPDGGTTQEIQYNANNNSQTIDFSGLGIDIHTNNAQAMTNALLNSSGSFTIDTRLKATAPDGTQQEIQYPSSAQSQTVSFNTLGLELDSSDAEQTATQLLNSSQGFTVNTRLKATAPDGTQQEIQYPSSAQSQTVSFNTLGLELDSSNAEQTATQLLNHSQGFTIDTRLKATAPDGTQQEIQYPSSAESQTVSFNTLGLELDSSNAEQTATQLLNHSQGFTIDTRLKATAPDGTQQEIQYPSSSESQTVSFSDLGLDVDSNNAQTTSNTVTQSLSDFQSQSYYVSDSP